MKRLFSSVVQQPTRRSPRRSTNAAVRVIAPGAPGNRRSARVTRPRTVGPPSAVTSSSARVSHGRADRHRRVVGLAERAQRSVLSKPACPLEHLAGEQRRTASSRTQPPRPPSSSHIRLVAARRRVQPLRRRRHQARARLPPRRLHAYFFRTGTGSGLRHELDLRRRPRARAARPSRRRAAPARTRPTGSRESRARVIFLPSRIVSSAFMCCGSAGRPAAHRVRRRPPAHRQRLPRPQPRPAPPPRAAARATRERRAVAHSTIRFAASFSSAVMRRLEHRRACSAAARAACTRRAPRRSSRPPSCRSRLRRRPSRFGAPAGSG